MARLFRVRFRHFLDECGGTIRLSDRRRLVDGTDREHHHESSHRHLRGQACHAISGDNLSVVAYRQSSSGTWTSQTWLDGPSAAVAWLNTQGETASFDQIDDAPQPIPLPSQTPVTLVAGVVEGDPLEEIVADPVIGPSVLAMLVTSGYPAADDPVSGEHDEDEPSDVNPCDDNEILNATLVVFQAPVQQVAASLSSALAATCTWCIPMIVFETTD
jgi:hypothetical protein